jgi:hypothetical protein
MKIHQGICVAFLLTTNLCQAFSLLGPYASWMDEAKGFRQPGELGGPMNLNEGYRWNTPMITYGFERSFIDYFGSTGVAAVEAAIQMLNQLPVAAQINVTNYPSEAWRVNYLGQALNLVDLKSTALSLLLEQIGLAKPEPAVWCVRDFATNGNAFNFAVIKRNFDSQTVQPSSYVNDTLFSYQLVQYSPLPTNGLFCDAIEFPIDPLASVKTTVAGFNTEAGYYVQQLSRDDVGGLRFLYNGNQIRYEQLLADVHLAAGTTNLIRSAYRSGVEKVTFVRQPAGTGGLEFQPVTNRWTDVYYIGSEVGYQLVERITPRPDIVFSARDLGSYTLYSRTGTTNWVNNAALNGNWDGAGPGVIAPGVTITFNNVGRVYYNLAPTQTNEANAVVSLLWGGFDGGTNEPVVYPTGLVAFQPSQVELNLTVNSRQSVFRWPLIGAAYGRFQLQTATNFNYWQTLATITNSGAIFHFNFTAPVGDSRRFFRTVGD